MDGISVIVPTAGRSKSLGLLLQSIQKQKLTASVEIIVVANTVQTIEKKQNIQSQIPEFLSVPVRLEFLAEEGVNRSRNHGLFVAKNEIIFFVDDDCEMDDPRLLQKHLFIHREQKNLFALGGVYEVLEDSSFFTRIYQNIQMHWLHQGLEAEGPKTRYLIGGHFSVKKTQCKKAQLHFDESIVYGGSELSFFKKAWEKKLAIELRDFSLRHHTHESFLSLCQKLLKQGAGQGRLEDDKNEKVISPLNGFWFSFFNFIFWWGYFAQRKNPLGFLKFILKTNRDYFVMWKYRHLDAVNLVIDSKKQRGDRL